jgi:hypothetical protein
MRLIDADELIERAYRERLDSRELIAQMIEPAPTVAVEDDYVALKKERDYWYKLAKSYEDTILKLCTALTKEKDG